MSLSSSVIPRFGLLLSALLVSIPSKASDLQVFSNAIIYGHYESDTLVTEGGVITFIGNRDKALSFAG